MGEGKARIAVLISGGGTNLQALIDAEKSGILHSGKIVCVILLSLGIRADKGRERGHTGICRRKKGSRLAGSV